ncbi:MAG: transcriptional regulator [Polynucleobacter sp. 24-46-87]|nr:MAG: transcriptional regulator [Polynucleobacter sp. 35-46-207]OYZ38881.1 MAG: transcriptional regulator [Polynucleobacter sp. 16-46-70]OZA13521.1 MAG: transcriptional regulator [Polynucleobacter sp. 24-46-87]OZA41626.1 MAG: transcriptional regulator [Polynucleobacter sp. 17-46-58]OZB48738.1 MAG: transcriptional regulator [Polynucleobacter sp. 39-45-136]
MSERNVSPERAILPWDGMSRWSQFKNFSPFSREKWRQLVLEGKAPQPVRLGTRLTMWRNADLHEFLADPVGYRVNKSEI